MKNLRRLLKTPFSKILHNTLLGGVFKSSVIAFIFRGMGAFSGFLMNLAVTRTIGAEQAGCFFIAFALVTILSSFSRLGLDNALIRFISQYKERMEWTKINGIIRKSIIWTLTVSSVCAILLASFADYLSVSIFNKTLLAAPLKAICISVVFISLSMIHGYALQGVQSIPKSVFTINISTQMPVKK